MKELTLGKKTNKELAEWFDITPGTFANRKKIKLQELAFFAEFHIEKGKVIIDQVKMPEYSKQSLRNYEKVHKTYLPYWGEGGKGLDTGKRVAGVIHSNLEQDEDYKVQESTTYKLVLQAIKEDFGKRGSAEGGPLGKCYYKLAKVNEQTGMLEDFTPEEQKIKKKVMKDIFGNDDESIIHLMKQHDDKEIDDKEFAESMKMIKNYNQMNYQLFIAELSKALNKVIKRGTYIEPSAF